MGDNVGVRGWASQDQNIGDYDKTHCFFPCVTLAAAGPHDGPAVCEDADMEAE